MSGQYTLDAQSSTNLPVGNSQYNVHQYVIYSPDMDKNEMMQEIRTQKRHELIWALSLQEWTQEDIADIMRGGDRSTISRIISKRPDDWKPKWIKQT